jgi:arylsulfatase
MKKKEGFHSKHILKFRPAERKTRYTFYPEHNGGGGVMLSGSFTITAFARYQKGDEGVLVSGGDNQGGHALYIQDGRLVYHHNWFGLKHANVISSTVLPEGDLALSVDFILIKPGEGVGRLLINGKPAGSLRLCATPLFPFAGLAIGRFHAVSVTGGMKEKKLWAYTGIFDRVEFNLARPLDDLDLMRKLEEELRRE